MQKEKKKGPISLELVRIKEKHGLTNEKWSLISKVPLGTLNRYLSYNSGIPSYPYICAMLHSVQESSDEFFDTICKAADTPAGTVDLLMPMESNNHVAPHQDPMLIPGMNERITEQAEKLQAQKDQLHELDAQLRELRIRNDFLESTLKDRDRSISHRNEIISEKNRTIRRCLIAIVLMALLIAYALWEIINIDKGLTSLLRS